MFNPTRLALARNRRGFTKKKLADAVGVTTRALTAYESGEYPPADDVVDRLSRSLDFPAQFFDGDSLDEPDANGVSFRSMKRMTAAQRHSVLAAGALAFELSAWIERRFALPSSSLLDLSGEKPEAAAEIVRQEWGLGELSIRNMVHLLEAKGVRVFSLAEDAKEIDAFSLWHGNTPHIFLNTFKSSVHSRYDAAHELGHLVLHKHGAPNGQDAEKEANYFAASFLMPRSTVLASAPRSATLQHLLQLKNKWLVSVAALARRLHDVGIISDWHYRMLCIQISERGYRTREPNDAPRETSRLWEKVFVELRQDGIAKEQIATELSIPVVEIEKLVWGLVTMGLSPPQQPTVGSKRRGNLRLIK